MSRFVDAPGRERCTATIRLRGGGEDDFAQCGRRAIHGTLCTQHAHQHGARKKPGNELELALRDGLQSFIDWKDHDRAGLAAFMSGYLSRPAPELAKLFEAISRMDHDHAAPR